MTDSSRGMLLGVLGVFLFALTLPMTRLAVGDIATPQLAPGFVAMGRAAVAGLLSILYLFITGSRRPTASETKWLLVTAAGVVFGWPLMLSLALHQVDAVHAAVITGVLPLATAAAGALLLRQRPSLGFWICALVGLALVIGFAAWRGAGALQAADALLLGAVLATSVGYVTGARLSLSLQPEQVISWLLVLSLPLTLPLAVAWAPRGTEIASIAPSAWVGFAYVALVSQWLGFFAWYRALALGGTLRVSQVQIVQPFVSMLAAVPLLGERLDLMTGLFAVAVIAVVWIGKRMPVQ